jgi:hypothetical protein
MPPPYTKLSNTRNSKVDGKGYICFWLICEMASTNQTHLISVLDNINIEKIEIDIKEDVLVFVQ